MNLKLPAIKGLIGDWVYYLSVMPFQEVINRIDNNFEIREYKTLDDHLQRELKPRSKLIAQYLLREDRRFFNSAIIGIYGDNPNWYTFDFQPAALKDMELDERIKNTIGILELSGNEILFSIDGQHRIEGIKQALKEDFEKFKRDELPMILIAHNNDRMGKRRTRRLFSEVNTKAVKVTGLDDLITNEDNPVLINTRKLYAEYPNFEKDKFIALNHKANIDANAKEFTTILNLAEVNKILYRSNYKDQRYRPSDTKLRELYEITLNFWDEALENIREYNSVLVKETSSVSDFRSDEGGSLLFRPIGIKLISEGFSKWKIEEKRGNYWNKVNSVDFSLEGKVWNNIIWNDISKQIIPKREKLIRELFLYLIDLPNDHEYLTIEFNKAHGIGENDRDKKRLPNKV